MPYTKSMTCSECNKPISDYSKTGLCVDCWHKYNRGENASNWRGGLNPYKIIIVNGVQVMEHRYMWEQAHGQIPNGYIIHHLNGDTKDNRLENLACLPRGHHNSIHGVAKQFPYLIPILQARIRKLEAKTK